MKPLLLFLLICLLHTANATNYYFSSSSGDDSRSSAEAQNPSTPWRSLDKLNAIFSSLRPGDGVYLRRGDVFDGAITATASGAPGQPITISAYGSGARPVISGLSTLSGWYSVGDNIWASYNAALGSSVNTVLLNDAAQEMGRYPNSDAFNKGYLTLESFVGNTSITDYQLSDYPNWTGAEVVIRKRLGIIDRHGVTTHSGNTIWTNASSADYPVAAVGFG
ncbi:MAG TPA: hypothetical protein VNA26_00455, partial [Chitinophagaceae bacterium]|nr:hypothetical protein [Chitinophagaceae bacterium]